MEGVMMKSKNNVAIAVRRENGEIVTKSKSHSPLSDKLKVSKIPFLRGFINFIDMMKLAMGTLTESAEMLDLFEDESQDNAGTQEQDNNAQAGSESKPVSEKKKSNMTLIASVIGIVLGLALSFGLFFFLPTFLGSTIENVFESNWDINLHRALRSMFEGVLRLVIFLAYILLVSQMRDIRRTFEYHGAEHMSIYAYEREEELTVENVRKHSRFHPRCGTSFLIIMIFIGFIVGLIIPQGLWFRVLIRLAMFPVVIGVAFEFIKFAGRHTDNKLVKIISAPGMWVQRLTTRKPDDEQLEVAIASLKLALNLEEPGKLENGAGHEEYSTET